jgi:hypothetical protein
MSLKISRVRVVRISVSEEFHKFYSSIWGVIRAQPVVGARRMINKPASELSVRKRPGKRRPRKANHSPPVGR